MGPSFGVVFAVAIFLLTHYHAVRGQQQLRRNELIRQMIEELGSRPPQQRSPSFSSSQHNFDVIGTGSLPLQGSAVDRPGRAFKDFNAPPPPSIEDVITGSLSRFENSASRKEDVEVTDTEESALPFLSDNGGDESGEDPVEAKSVRRKKKKHQQHQAGGEWFRYPEEQFILTPGGSPPHNSPVGRREERPRKQKRPNKPIGGIIGDFISGKRPLPPPPPPPSQDQRRPPQLVDDRNFPRRQGILGGLLSVGGKKGARPPPTALLAPGNGQTFVGPPLNNNVLNRVGPATPPRGPPPQFLSGPPPSPQNEFRGPPRGNEGPPPRPDGRPAFLSQPIPRPGQDQRLPPPPPRKPLKKGAKRTKPGLPDKHNKLPLPPPKGFQPPEATYNGFEPSFHGSDPVEPHDVGQPNEDHENDDSEEPLSPPKRSPTTPQPTKKTKKPVINDEKKSTVTDKDRPPKKETDEKQVPTRPVLKPEPVPDLDPPTLFVQRPAAPSVSNAAAPTRKPTLPSPPNIFDNRFKEPIFLDKVGGNDGAGDSDLGFFDGAQESFPDISDFGLSWDPQKVARTSQRSKRAAPTRIVLKNPFYYRDERRKQRASRGQNSGRLPPPPASLRPAVGDRRSAQGPTGFWDNTEFDSDFFNDGSPGPVTSTGGYNSGSYEDFSSGGTLPPPIQKYAAAIQSTQYQQKPARLSYSPAPQYEKPGHVTTATASGGYYSGSSNSNRDSYYNVEDNEILGSGNFDIIKGGTFYDQNDYQYVPYSNNQRPSYVQYGKDYFHNFKDFADIKDRNTDENFY